MKMRLSPLDAVVRDDLSEEIFKWRLDTREMTNYGKSWGKKYCEHHRQHM